MRSKGDEELGLDDVLAKRVRDFVLVVPGLAHGLIEVCLGEHLRHGGQVEPRAQVVGDEAEHVDGRAVVLDGEVAVARISDLVVRGGLCANQAVSRVRDEGAVKFDLCTGGGQLALRYHISFNASAAGELLLDKAPRSRPVLRVIDAHERVTGCNIEP